VEELCGLPSSNVGSGSGSGNGCERSSGLKKLSHKALSSQATAGATVGSVGASSEGSLSAARRRLETSYVCIDKRRDELTRVLRQVARTYIAQKSGYEPEKRLPSTYNH